MFAGHRTWSCVREQYAQKVSENMVVNGKLGAAREEVRQGFEETL